MSEETRELAWDDPEQRNAAWHSLILSEPRELTLAEFDAALPPRGPVGSTQNRVRGVRVRMLSNRGFTVRHSGFK